MAETSFPFDAGAGSSVLEDGWGRMARLWSRSGVLVPEWSGGVGSLAAGSINGLKVALGAGLQVTVAVGEAMVKGFYYANDTSKPLTVSSNSSGNPRLDWVVLELDRVNNQIIAKVVAGTPAASPVLPTLVQLYNGIWQHPIGYYTVANAAVAPTVLTDYRTAAPMPDGWDWCSTFKAAGQSVGNATPTKLTWNNGLSGNANFYSVANNWFVIPFNGFYTVQARVYQTNSAGVTESYAELLLNNNVNNILDRRHSARQISGWYYTSPGVDCHPFTAGDTVHVHACPFGAAAIPDVASVFRIKYIPYGI